MHHSLIANAVRNAEVAGVIPPDAGIAVSIVADGREIFSDGFGLRERDRKLPVTRDTIFDLCSLTKAFTAAIYLEHDADGTIVIDAPLNDDVQRFPLHDPEASREVTIRDILAHRVGVPANNLLWYFGSTTPDMLHIAMSALEAVPGAFRHEFMYNNIAYGTLGHLAEILANESLQQSVIRKICTPLQMTSASFNEPMQSNDIALPYNGTQHIDPLDMSVVAAAGAMKMSVADFAQWMLCVLGDGKSSNGDTILRTQTVREMHTAQIGVQTPDPVILQGLEWLGSNGVSYGLGWFLGQVFGERVMYHPGLADGFSNAVVIVPSRNVGVAVFTNLNLSPAPGVIIREVLDALFQQPSVSELQNDGAQPVDIDRARIGTYENAAYGAVQICWRAGAPELHYKQQVWSLRSVADASAEFTVSAFGITFPMTATFTTNESGQQILSIPFALDPRVQPVRFVRKE